MSFMPAPTATRRTVLSGAVLTAAAAAAGPLAGQALGVQRLRAATAPIRKPLPTTQFVVYGTNAEMRWESVERRRLLTAGSALFVRNHTTTPTIRRDDYRLRVHGDGLTSKPGGGRTRVFSLAELKELPHTELTSVLECTGNGRSFFATQQGTPAAGTPWTLGAVGAVRWTGVLVRDLLDAVGLRDDAVSVLATGLDDPYVDKGVDQGRVRRPFSIEKALDDAILAWGMDGRPLPPDHGFPLRLVLPGWVGIASIKWLGSLEVSRGRLESPWSTTYYRMTGPGWPADAPPLTVNPVRSAWELARGATLAGGAPLLLSGRSWSGAAPIRRVDVSLDGGASWQRADIRRSDRLRAGDTSWRGRGPHDQSWTRWSVLWETPTPGAHVLMARATDARGRTQPLLASYNDAGYFFDAVVRHPVTVV
jgi:DMSO/TMAO reductase YedYZ molybdopterin-dependent catalytic subunit